MNNSEQNSEQITLNQPAQSRIGLVQNLYDLAFESNEMRAKCLRTLLAVNRGPSSNTDLFGYLFGGGRVCAPESISD